MEIIFNGKEYQFDDVIYSWTIKGQVRQYIASVSFCGGIDENGEDNLYSSCNAEVMIQETNHKKFYDTEDNNNGILKQVLNEIKDSISDEIEYYNGLSGEYFRFVNESSFDSTMDDFNTVFGTLVNVLRERENPIIA